MNKGLMAELNSVPFCSHRQGTRASLWSECGQWEGFVTGHNSFYIYHVTDSSHRWNISQERQYSRGHQTYSPGIRLQVLSLPAHTLVRISRLKPLGLLSRMPGQCVKMVMWYIAICSKVILQTRRSTYKLTFIEYLLCARHLPTPLKLLTLC